MTNHHYIILPLLIGIISSSLSCKQTPTIHDYIYLGNNNEVQYLINSGKGINERDYWGNTPLHLASINGSKDLAEALLMNGADINARAFRGRTPLMLAIHHGHSELAWYYLSQGAEIKTRYKQTNTLFEAVLAGDVEMVSYLLDHGYNVDTVNHFNVSALHIAVMQGNQEIVRLLIRNGANINLKTTNGWSALHFAANTQSMKIVDELIDQGSEIFILDSDGAAAFSSGIIYEQMAKRRQNIIYRRQVGEFYRQAASAYTKAEKMYKEYATNAENDIDNSQLKNNFSMSLATVFTSGIANTMPLNTPVIVPQKNRYSLETLRTHYENRIYQTVAGYKRCINATR